MKKKEEEKPQRVHFDNQDYLLKYITGFFGYKDVQFDLNQVYRGSNDEDLKTMIVTSKDKHVYEILIRIFNHLFDSHQIEDNGELTMVKTISYDENEQTMCAPYIRDWEREFYQVILEFVHMTLKSRM